MSIGQAIIDIAELPCGEPPAGWADLAVNMDQDAWQIAFSAGLMSAIERLNAELPTKDARCSHEWDYTGEEGVCTKCGLTASATD